MEFIVTVLLPYLSNKAEGAINILESDDLYSIQANAMSVVVVVRNIQMQPECRTDNSSLKYFYGRLVCGKTIS